MKFTEFFAKYIVCGLIVVVIKTMIFLVGLAYVKAKR